MKETLEKWFEEVWTKENTSIIKEMFVPEGQGSATGINKTGGIGPDKFITFQSQLLGLLSNIVIVIDDSIESGNIISAQCTMTGKDRKTGTKNLSTKGCVVAKITDGKIRNADNYFDFLNLFEDLGLLPEDTFSKCLNAQSLR